MAKSRRVMQVEHEGETMWLYDNGDIRNTKGHLKGKGEVPQSYTDGLKKIAKIEEVRQATIAKQEVAKIPTGFPKEPDSDLPVPPPAPPEIKEPPMNDLQIVLNIGTKTPDGFEVSFTKSKVIGSHNIKVISGAHRHKLQEALQRIVLQANTDLRAIRDAPLVEQYRKEAERDAKKAAQKKELKDLLKAI